MPLCRVYHCKTSSGSKIPTHRFPAHNTELARKWLVACKIQWKGSLKDFDFKNKVVCSKHFADDAYEPDLYSKLMVESGLIDKPRPRRLKPDAVPTLDLTATSTTTFIPQRVTTLNRIQRQEKEAQKRAVSVLVNSVSRLYLYSE